MGKQVEEAPRKKICVGLLAHVDAGKTTLSEAMLYQAGALKKLGRVDHGNACLDTHELERSRGITIFSSGAAMRWGELDATLVDTPGHVDFSTETERTLQVLDYAVMVIAGPDGVQAHTVTLWELLRQYHVPTFLFVNKTDLPGPGEEAIMEDIRKNLSANCVSFSQPVEGIYEEAATAEETALEEYLERETLSRDTLCRLVKEQTLFPCFFGAALKLQGVEALLNGLEMLTRPASFGEGFGAKVYKISRDPQGVRLTWMKVTGGTLQVRSPVSYTLPDGEKVEEKAKELRLYQGDRYIQSEQAEPGTIVAVAGLSKTRPGQGLGLEPDGITPKLEPVMTFGLELPQGVDPARMMPKLQELCEEDPQLSIVWDQRLQQIQARLMGTVQCEVLKSVIMQRFGVEVRIGTGRILYKETIKAPTEGVGHYEPLRHYAEVHVLLEPLPRGSGLEFGVSCKEDQLDRNWQRLILCHLMEKTHRGVLTGSPVTDLRITLISGRAHVKHTEGGDFRQATYRAVRQGLMGAESVLLEPCYQLRLTVPLAQVGRAMQDLQTMGAKTEQTQVGDTALFTGTVPVSGLGDYAAQVASYTHGQGRLFCRPGGYVVCKEAQQVIEAMDYDPEADLENTPDSVFCAHGSGFHVKWNQVSQYMHLPALLAPKPQPRAERPREDREDLELEKIMEREFGPIKRPVYTPPRVRSSPITAPAPAARTEYLLVDGYNIIFAWPELKELAREDLEEARNRLMDILSNYCGFSHREVVLIFDGYRVKGNRGERFLYHNLLVIYTKENETADAYIEALALSIGRNERVYVATSDNLVRLSAFRSGILRVSAQELQAQVEACKKDMQAYLKKQSAEDRYKEQQARNQTWSRMLKDLKLP